MSVTDLDVQYTSQSRLSQQKGIQQLVLAHHTEIEEVQSVPCFFWGSMVDPLLVSKCLLTVSKVVRSNFSPTPTRLLDPIVTAGQEQIRFEGFSSCNGVYARLDLLEDAVEGEFIANGTTNVDFNEPMLNALNAVKKNEVMVMGVGDKEVKVSTSQGTVVEKKVTLPQRWIKGLTSVQLYLADMHEKFELNKIQVVQLFQSLPKTTTRSAMYLSYRANRYHLSPVAMPNSVQIGGIERLRLLDGLLPYIEKMTIFQATDGQSCAVQVYLKHMRLTLAISPECRRGFSGEGNVLESMIQDVPLEWIHGLNSLLKANQSFNPTMLSIEHAIDFSTMDHLTSSLSSMGLLGFDLHDRQHYYRRLPFKLERILSLNPRLKNAKKLVSDDSVQFIRHEPQLIEARVSGTDVQHTVLIRNDIPQCTCEWFNKHQTQRGLCKHILAVKIAQNKI